MENETLVRRNFVVLSVVPVAIFCLAAFFRELQGPYHLWRNSDPDYAYLLNSVNILGLQAPRHIDHPGTTLQLLGAVAIFLTWLPSHLLIGDHSVQDAVLADPELYLASISTFLTILISAATLLAGLQALRTWGSVLPALAIQLSLFLFVQVPTFFARVTPEPLLIVAGLILISALIPSAMSTNVLATVTPARSAWVGLAIGFGVATKITFLPVFGFILLFEGWRRKAAASFSCALGFIVFTAPILPQYRNLFGWLRALATHKGSNGAGDSGLPEPSALLGNVGFLFSVASPLFLLLGFYLFLLIVLRTSSIGVIAPEVGALRRLLSVGCVVIALQIAITAKNPGGYYMLPSMVMCGLMNSAVLLVAMRANREATLAALARSAVAGILVAAVLIAAGQVYTVARSYDPNSGGTLDLAAPISSDAVTVVDYFGSSRPVYALAFGNDYAGRNFDARLRALYPNAIFYSIWEGYFYSFAGEIQDAEINRMPDAGLTVLMYGTPLEPDSDPGRKRLVLEPIFVGSHQAIYRLVRVEEPR